MKASSKNLDPLKAKGASEDLVGFDLLFQLAHLSSVAAAGVPRERMFELAGEIPAATAPYFREVDRYVTALGYQYAEACRMIGEVAKNEEVKELLLRLSSALATGEKESDFLANEAQVQAEVYGNVYERKLETLKKWTDAFSALIVSASLIIVVATVSTMIFDLGTPFVAGLVIGMLGISALGVWIIYRAAPREVKTLTTIAAEESQLPARRLFITLGPLSFIVAGIMAAAGMSVGMILIVAGLIVLPIGIQARRLDAKIAKQDGDISTFLRVLGSTVTAIGTTPVIALGRMDLRAMASLASAAARLRIRLLSRVAMDMSWDRFVSETGSELIGRSVRVFQDGVKAGGDAEEIGKRASVLSTKVSLLRAKRRLVSSSFWWLTFAMHVTIAFLLIFIIEVVDGFNELIQTAGVLGAAEGGAAGSVGSVLAFNVQSLQFLQMMMIPVVICLSVVNAAAPKLADGGYGHTFFYYLGFTLVGAGIALVAAPVLADLIFGVGATASTESLV